MRRKLKNAVIATVATVGVVLMMSGVSMMEQTATDWELYPYIARAFAGLSLCIAATVVYVTQKEKAA